MNNRKLWLVDWGLLIPTVVLVMLSMSTLFSINTGLFKSQAVFLLISIVAYLFFSQINFNILRFYSLPIYIISIVLLGLVLIIGIETRGSVRWIDIFGFRMQFSELLKPFLAVSFASFLDGRKNTSLKDLMFSLLLLLPIAFLIFLQPDLGNAVIYVGIAILTLVFYGFSLRFFAVAVAPVLAVVPFFWNFMHEYQRQRVLTFFNPGHDPLGTSYNAIQSTIAVGSGMFFGKGFGQGTQSQLSFLPERHTDFIFATISESLGFFGGLLILVSLAFLFFRLYRIAEALEDRYIRVFVVVAFFLILTQSFVNIGMNIGILPIVGVTLPFVSYGGSSLLSSFILLGMVSAAARSKRLEDILEIK